MTHGLSGKGRVEEGEGGEKRDFSRLGFPAKSAHLFLCLGNTGIWRKALPKGNKGDLFGRIADAYGCSINRMDL